MDSPPPPQDFHSGFGVAREAAPIGGRPVLEIAAQAEVVPQPLLDEATEKRVIIRTVEGRILNSVLLDDGVMSPSPAPSLVPPLPAGFRRPWQRALQATLVVNTYFSDQEIISKPRVQIARLSAEKALALIDDLVALYHPGQAGETVGELDGDLVLELPVQRRRIPPAFLEHAREQDVIVRDSRGRVHEPERGGR
jgi:hypothetical protein